MATQGIENPENPRKQNNKEILGGHGHGHGLQPSNVPSKIDVNLDNLQAIFDVPDDVLANIFSFLPIKQAVQASALSPTLKQSWFLNRKLCFDKDFAKCHDQKEFMDIVNRVFNLHAGRNIQTLSLFFDPTGVEDAVQNWIQMSIHKGVEELDLNFSLAKDLYKITTDLADIETIKILKLRHCEINKKSIETLFSNCLSLETLELVKCRSIGHLRILARNLRNFKVLKVGDCLSLSQITIAAPTLRTFYYTGTFIIFQFDEISQLNDVILDFQPLRNFGKFFRRDSFLCDLSHIPILSASNSLLEDLSPASFNQRSLLFNFWNLKELQLIMKNGIYCNLYHIAYFLRKCPILEKLFIDLKGFSFGPQEIWEYQRGLVEGDTRPFRCLQFIKMEGFEFEKHEIEIVKYLLKRAIVLETLVLVGPKTTQQGAMNDRNIAFCRKICESAPVSSTAKVRFYDRDMDESPVPKHSKTWFEQ